MLERGIMYKIAKGGADVKSDPKYNHYRRNDEYHNSLTDDFVFVREVNRESTVPIVPLMAGKTNENPEYFIDLRKNGCSEIDLTIIDYVVSGSGYVSYNGVTRRVSKGDIYILPPTFNGEYRADRDDPFVKKFVNIGGYVLPALMRAYGIESQINVFRDCPWAEAYIDEMHEILGRYDESDHDADDLKLTHVLVDLINRLSKVKKERENTGKTINIETIVGYIEGNVAVSKITVDSLSKRFYVSSQTITRMFEKHYGMTAIKFITLKKIDCAKRMLADGHGVEEVSQMLFFSNAEYFRKVFVSVCGISPQKYKSELKKKY